MSGKSHRNLQVFGGFVQCLPDKREEVVKCRFCVHSVQFKTQNAEISSPARAFCSRVRSTDEVDLKDIVEVVCDDVKQEGYRSMLNVIS